jgi:hypothetical protein
LLVSNLEKKRMKRRRKRKRKRIKRNLDFSNVGSLHHSRIPLRSTRRKRHKRKKGSENDNRLIRGLASRLVRVGYILLVKTHLLPCLLLPDLHLALPLLLAEVLLPIRLLPLLLSELVLPTTTLDLFSQLHQVGETRGGQVDHSIIGDREKRGVKYQKMLWPWSLIVRLVNLVKSLRTILFRRPIKGKFYWYGMSHSIVKPTIGIGNVNENELPLHPLLDPHLVQSTITMSHHHHLVLHYRNSRNYYDEELVRIKKYLVVIHLHRRLSNETNRQHHALLGIHYHLDHSALSLVWSIWMISVQRPIHLYLYLFQIAKPLRLNLTLSQPLAQRQSLSILQSLNHDS